MRGGLVLVVSGLSRESLERRNTLNLNLELAYLCAIRFMPPMDVINIYLHFFPIITSRYKHLNSFSILWKQDCNLHACETI